MFLHEMNKVQLTAVAVNNFILPLLVPVFLVGTLVGAWKILKGIIQ